MEIRRPAPAVDCSIHRVPPRNSRHYLHHSRPPMRPPAAYSAIRHRIKAYSAVNRTRTHRLLKRDCSAHRNRLDCSTVNQPIIINHRPDFSARTRPPPRRACSTRSRVQNRTYLVPVPPWDSSNNNNTAASLRIQNLSALLS